MSQLHFQPVRSQVRQILRAILETPEVASCRLKDTMLIRLACEEIVTNVATHAYPDGTDGFLDVDVMKTADRIVIRFKDGGIPFNPLGQAPPDLSQPWMQRRIGGLGIYLVRRKMDDVSYTYVDNSNVLTIEKVILNTIKEE